MDQDLAILTAGLVANSFDDLNLASETDIAEALRSQLTAAGLWERLAGVDLGVAPGNGRLPTWSDPGLTIDEHLSDRLIDAWASEVPPAPDDGMQWFLRLAVHDIEAANQLRRVGPISGRTVVPVIRQQLDHFVWRWPLRVGIVDGPQSQSWLDRLRAERFSADVYDAEIVDPTSTDPYEIVILDASLGITRDDPVALTVHQSACVIVLASESPEVTLGPTADLFECPITIALQTGDVFWWHEFYRELTHDIPIDAAITAAHPSALITADDTILAATAIAQWLMLAVGDTPEVAPIIDEMRGWDFLHEDEGGSQISHRVRDLRRRGTTPSVEFHGRRAAASSPPPPEPEAVGGRRLVAEFWDGDTPRRKVLPPATELLLEIRIAVPEQGEIAADQGFADPEATGPTALLEIVVTSAVWAAPQRATMSLPMDHRHQPSQPVAFSFTSPTSGNVVEFEIVVLFKNRPLQAATLTATCRDQSTPRDRPTLIVHSLSSPSEPTDELTPADASIDARGAELRNQATDAILVIDVQGQLKSFEDQLSRVLGVPGAPGNLDHVDVLDMLIKVARKGSELRTLLAELDLATATSINLLISAFTPVLPIELAYEGTPPQRGAKLCGHVTNPPATGETCDRTSKRVVCPYAFWGMHRSIARTVQSSRRSRSTAPGSLPITMVLYGATRIADDGVTAGPTPTGDVLAATQQLFGSTDDKPVSSWTQWTQRVKSDKPQLLVMLAHTETENGEVALHIGKTSFLARPDVGGAVIRAGDAPRPIVVMMACASAALGDPFGTLPGMFAAHGAAAVVGTLSKMTGPNGAVATIEVLRAIRDAADAGAPLSTAVQHARRALVENNQVLGLLLVTHGEVDTIVRT